MASDDSSGTRGPIVLRIKLRYDDLETMVQRFATNVGKSGLFLPTKSLQPLGAEIKFELRLADDTPALVGLGRVKATTAPDPGSPRAAFGMAIELMRVTPQSRALILRMLERRRAIGLPETQLPMATDIDAARRAEAVEGVRDFASGPVASVVVGEPAVVRPLPALEPVPDGLLTAPRRTTRPTPAAQIYALAPLAAEPPRRKRVAVGEVLEAASGPTAAIAVPGLDDEVDVVAVLARARALVGGSLDAELEALAEAVSVPVAVEVSVDGASAELARQLGGLPVRRDRSARWAPPPATIPAEPVVEAIAEPVVEAIAEPVDEAIAEPVVEAAAEPVVEAAPAAEAVHEVEPAQIADEIHELSDFDLEDVEHTEMGAIPVEEAFGAQAEPSEAPDVDQMLLAARIEADLAAAEADEDDDLGVAIEHAPASAEPPVDLSLEEIDEFEILAEADAHDEDLLGAHGEQDISNHRARAAGPSPVGYEEPLSVTRPSQLDFASRLDLGDDSDADFALPGHPPATHVLDGAGDDLADAPPLPDDPDEHHDRFARRIVQPVFEPEPSGSFTLAGIPDDDFELPPRTHEPAPLRPPRDPEPVILRGLPDHPSLHAAPVDDHELEHALDALDVDLDDLSIPHAATQLQRGAELDPSRPTTAISPAARAATPSRGLRLAADDDDEVIIDFEDD